MARRLPDGRDVPADERRIAFLTWFPTQWTEWRGVMRDRHYVDLPEAIAKRGNRRPFYACLLPAGSWRHLAGGVRAAAREIAAHEPGAMIFVERFARVRDVLRRYLDLRAALTYWWLERFDAAFRRSFDWDGVDVFPLLRHDLRVSFVRDLPFLELLALRVRNLVRHLQPADLVTTLETYGYGRAVAWGAHTSGLPVRVIGFQHSAVNSNQLVYRFSPAEVGNSPPYVDHMPLPDEYVAYGEHARSMLERSGVSGDRIFICGGPRFDDLTQFRRQRCERFDESRSAFGIAPAERMVLVATVIWPGLTARLLEWCGMAVSRIPGLAIVVKPHPLHKHIEREIVAAFSAVSGRVIVSHGNLNALQAAADVMIGTAGTTDIEAIAIGCPVIRVHTADFDFSPSSDEPGATLDVTSAEELKAAVARVLAGAWRPENTDVLVEKAFYKLDGREIDRVIAALERFDLRATAPA
jgi:surface carbohydrate biosynthesis protein (TIGR04326 family)